MPIITLTTDFGTADHFSGSMKGVILGIAPRAQIVDITHEVTPFNLIEGAFEVAQSWRYFPKGTIHVAVVDPGVGSARRPILVEAAGHSFIGPDNGIFSFIYEAAKFKTREITNPKLMLKDVSRTFHGRDIFAPAAAHLANKTPAAKFGKLMHDPIRIASLHPVALSKKAWTGSILKVDRFGNLITCFHVEDFAKVKTHPMELRVGSHKIHRFAITYSDTEIGDLFVVVGSSGYLEIASNQGSAAAMLGFGAGAPVELEFD